jgi:hypothetical protein
MRKIIFVLLMFPALSYSQKKVSPEIINEIKMADLIVSPDDYLLGVDTSLINFIDFQRENNFSKTRNVFACITRKDGFNKDYSIGQIFQYLRSETQAGYFINVYLKDGTSITKHVALDFSNGSIPESEDFEAADYDVEGEPFGGTWDGIEVTAL